MTRSVWKGPYIDFSLLKKIIEAKKSGSRKPISTYARRCTIIPQFVGMTISVYNGKQFVPVAVKETMVGFKLGAFSPTRKFPGHASDKKAKKG